MYDATGWGGVVNRGTPNERDESGCADVLVVVDGGASVDASRWLAVDAVPVSVGAAPADGEAGVGRGNGERMRNARADVGVLRTMRERVRLASGVAERLRVGCILDKRMDTYGEVWRVQAVFHCTGCGGNIREIVRALYPFVR